jgi:hypothetical protein
MVLYGFPYPDDVLNAVKLFQGLGYIYQDIADAVELLICPIADTIRKPVRTPHYDQNLVTILADSQARYASFVLGESSAELLAVTIRPDDGPG